MSASPESVVLGSVLSVVSVVLIVLCVFAVNAYYYWFQEPNRIAPGQPDVPSLGLENPDPWNDHVSDPEPLPDNNLREANSDVAESIHRPNCAHFRLCEEYLQILNFPDHLRNRNFDFCYCDVCLTNPNQNAQTVQNERTHLSSTVDGWAQFGLKVKRDAADQQECFYGVRDPDNIVNIIGRKLFVEDKDKHVVTSPSIWYASSKEFAVKARFDAASGKKYNALLVLKLKQQRNRYVTLSRRYRIENLPDDGELIHWLSDSDSIEPYAIMMRVTKLK